MSIPWYSRAALVIPASPKKLAKATDPGGFAVGAGFNSFTQEKRGTALEAVVEIAGANGQMVKTDLKRGDIERAAWKQLGIDTSYSGPIKAVDLSVDVKCQFESTFNINRTYLIVVQNIQNSTSSITYGGLTDEARSLIGDGGMTREKYAQFYSKFGDRFVSGRVTGGELRIVYEFNTRTLSEAKNLQAALEVAAKKYKGKFDLDAALREVSTDTETLVSCYLLAGAGIATPTSANEIVDLIKNFPSLVLQHPCIVGIETTDYMAVPGFPVDEVTRDLYTVIAQDHRILDPVAEALGVLLNCRQAFNELRTPPANWVPARMVPVGYLDTTESRIATLETQVRRQITSTFNGGTNLPPTKFPVAIPTDKLLADAQALARELQQYRLVMRKLQLTSSDGNTRECVGVKRAGSLFGAKDDREVTYPIPEGYHRVPELKWSVSKGGPRKDGGGRATWVSPSDAKDGRIQLHVWVDAYSTAKLCVDTVEAERDQS